MFVSWGWVVMGNALRCSLPCPAKQGRPTLGSLGGFVVQPPGNFHSTSACSMFLHVLMPRASLFDSLRLFGSHKAQQWLFLALFQSLAINFTLQWGALVTVQRRRERKPHRLASQRQYLIVFTNNNLPIIASAPSPPLHRRGWVYSLNCWR